jgi:hypothetical protein
VSGHRSRSALWLVVPTGVEDEFSDEFAGVFGDDPDVPVADEHEDGGAGPAAADADVVQSAGVAQGEFAVAVDAVFADAEVFADLDALSGGDGSGSRGPGGGGGAAADGAVRPVVVVVVGEGVELGLEFGGGGGGGLPGEPVLEGLVQSLDAPMLSSGFGELGWLGWSG